MWDDTDYLQYVKSGSAGVIYRRRILCRKWGAWLLQCEGEQQHHARVSRYFRILVHHVSSNPCICGSQYPHFVRRCTSFANSTFCWTRFVYKSNALQHV